MKKKAKACIRSIVVTVLMLATTYFFFIRQQLLWAGLCFIGLGIHGIITRSAFTNPFMVGLLLMSITLPNPSLRVAAIIVVGLPVWAELAHIPKLRKALANAKASGADFRDVMWEHDFSVRVWKRLTTEKKPNAT